METKNYIISVFSENQAGVLNRITAVFLKRKINIETLKVSETTIKGISMFSIEVNISLETAEKVVRHIEKIVEVISAEFHTVDELITQEIALYKVDSNILKNGKLDTITGRYNARIVEANREYTVLEMTGYRKETEAMRDELDAMGLLLQYTRSGTVALYQGEMEERLKQLDKK